MFGLLPRIKKVYERCERRYFKKFPFIPIIIFFFPHLFIYIRSLFRFREPKIKFIIFCQGRTGSTLLVDLLNSHPEIECDSEILIHRALFPHRLIKGFSTVSPHKVYGFKLKIYQLKRKQKIRDIKGFMQKLHQDRWKIIYLERGNLFRQALSNFYASFRDEFHLRKSDGSHTFVKMHIDCDQLIDSIKKRKQYLVAERKVLSEIPHLRINYERDLLRTDCHPRTLNKLFDFLGVSRVPVKTQMLRISKDDLSDMIVNLDEVETSLKKAGLLNYFC